MKENIVQKLTSKDDKYACAFTDRIVAESRDTDICTTTNVFASSQDVANNTQTQQNEKREIK